MNDRQPGLRKRMELEARRIFSQHRQLDELFGIVAEALGRGSCPEACRAFRHFCDALRSHFEIEETTHFPAIHGMDPESDAGLAGLVREHVAFREQLGELEALLEADELDGSKGRLEKLADQLASHEEVEERLFERATGESAPSR